PASPSGWPVPFKTPPCPIDWMSCPQRDCRKRTRAHAMYGNDVRVESLGPARRLTIGFKAIHLGATQLLRVNLAGVSFERSTDDFLHLSIPLIGSFRRRTRAVTRDFSGSGKASVGRPFDCTKLEVADASVLVFYAPRGS